MPLQRFEQKQTDTRAIELSMLDNGIDTENWDPDNINIGDYTDICNYIGAGVDNIDFQTVIKYSSEPHSISRLYLLAHTDLATAVKCIQLSGSVEAVSYLSKRIEFYTKLIKGTATQTVKSYDFVRECEVVNTVNIDNSNVTPESIHRGLFRDILYAAMIGTPELAIYSLARARNPKVGDFCVLKGYESQIDHG